MCCLCAYTNDILLLVLQYHRSRWLSSIIFLNLAYFQFIQFCPNPHNPNLTKQYNAYHHAISFLYCIAVNNFGLFYFKSKTVENVSTLFSGHPLQQSPGSAVTHCRVSSYHGLFAYLTRT